MIESLPADVQHFIQSQVSAGNYPSAVDVVIDAVSRLREHEENYQRLRAEVQRRLKSLDEGNYIELNGDEELAQFFDELKQELRDKYAVKQER
jgi:putative addiction module CopG family antidote